MFLPIGIACMDQTKVFLRYKEENFWREHEAEIHTMFFSSEAHFLKIWSDNPAWSIPGVANTTCRETSTTSTQYSFITGYQGVSNDSPLIQHTTHSNKFLILFALMENSTLIKEKGLSHCVFTVCGFLVLVVCLLLPLVLDCQCMICQKAAK